ncbi:UNVERIFIED_CONTAM: hypothetical protein Sangu_2334000 [Sesamum angustifolium]|uniref:Uncharacterized protein n=1 Tax=Sesamum angustifolium TaxID=2727405 RepID=A0AAW2L6J3_9LAMI
MAVTIAACPISTARPKQQFLDVLQAVSAAALRIPDWRIVVGGKHLYLCIFTQISPLFADRQEGDGCHVAVECSGCCAMVRGESLICFVVFPCDFWGMTHDCVPARA